VSNTGKTFSPLPDPPLHPPNHRQCREEGRIIDTQNILSSSQNKKILVMVKKLASHARSSGFFLQFPYPRWRSVSPYHRRALPAQISRCGEWGSGLVGKLDKFAVGITREEAAKAINGFGGNILGKGTKWQTGDEDDFPGAIDQGIDDMFRRSLPYVSCGVSAFEPTCKGSLKLDCDQRHAWQFMQQCMGDRSGACTELNDKICSDCRAGHGIRKRA
ncbi:hypothetical protein, partial [Aromatoleum diolicum]|uniref:hypothetical protein n=1 Tax=Aromatoleum diolicum TaxID=75796 RepID=UPI001B7CE13F